VQDEIRTTVSPTPTGERLGKSREIAEGCVWEDPAAAGGLRGDRHVVVTKQEPSCGVWVPGAACGRNRAERKAQC
jgi:hypothetical protein